MFRPATIKKRKQVSAAVKLAWEGRMSFPLFQNKFF